MPSYNEYLTFSVGDGVLSRRSGSAVWIGALSFEERCVNSIEMLSREEFSLDRTILLDYPTQAVPELQDLELRKVHLARMMEASAKVNKTPIERKNVVSHSFQEFYSLLDFTVQEDRSSLYILDATCLSKVHTLALAAVLNEKKGADWIVAYSVPENYQSVADEIANIGWKDIIVAPLAETAYLFNEISSRGIILPGHDVDRLIIALSELEPAGGTIVMADTPRRPDLRQMSFTKNKNIIRQLEGLQSRVWKTETVGLHDLDLLEKLILDEVELAKEKSAPIILFPFGPKLHVFFAGLLLCELYPEASWFVYPIPHNYGVNYTEGVDTTLWLQNPLFRLSS